MHTGVLLGDLREQGYMKKLGVNGIIIVITRCILKIYSESYGTINPSQGSNKRQAVVNAVMNLRVQINAVAWELSASQEGPCSIQLVATQAVKQTPFSSHNSSH
jgi:hypothetical protein